MATPTGALNVFCELIFEYKSRTMDSYPLSVRPEIMSHAINIKQYSRSIFDATLEAGKITQAQYDTMSAMPNFPAAMAQSAEAEVLAEE